MWSFWYVERSRCVIFGILIVQDVDCFESGIFSMWEASDMEYWGCGLFGKWNVLDLEFGKGDACRDVGCWFTNSSWTLALSVGLTMGFDDGLFLHECWKCLLLRKTIPLEKHSNLQFRGRGLSSLDCVILIIHWCSAAD